MRVNALSPRGLFLLSAVVCAMSIKAAPASAQSYTVLHGFEIPSFPSAVLVQGSDGDFYGTTHGGGASGYGTVFKITPAGELTTLHSFAGFPAGAGPDAGLVEGSDGGFYGTTEGGGAGSYGTVFKITPAGELTTIYSFAGSDGAFPYSGLVQGSDGNLYGTTSQGGASGYGTVFKITPAGELATLHSFAGFPVGAFPHGALVQGTDGDFYGTTGGGGAGRNGTVFKITPAGELTILYSFVGFPDGSGGSGGLVQSTDGDFYGTTVGGGVFGLGTIFKITPAGTLTTLYSFKRFEGAHPYAGLIQATDGDFYGTTFDGGASDLGTVFKVTPAGALTTLHSFAGSDGQSPFAGLIRGTDGDFYGTTYRGGPLEGGVVFRLTPAPSPTVAGVSPANGPVSGGTIVKVSGMGFQPGATVSFGVVASLNVTYVSATTIYALTPVHAAGAVTVTVTNPDFQAGSLPSAYTYTCSWTPTALNGGPYCEGSTISLWATTFSGATYSWTGPNGFASALQNPTIASATAANAGTYSVTVTVAGCISAAGNTTVVIDPLPAAPGVTAPATVVAGSPNWTASVAAHAGSTYAWLITNGTITAGQGTSQITFTAGTAGTPLTLSVTETISSGCTSAPGTASVTVLPASSALQFYTFTPCRQLDTRSGSPLASGGTLAVSLTGEPCGLPSGASAVSVNLTVTQQTAQGFLTIYPADEGQPLISNINFKVGASKANNAILGLSIDGTGGVNVYNGSGGTVHVILDVNGYFQ